ncbi:MAG: response regulator transcription factor [Acidimicrobiales bacterium]|nr:response regulator transcription factor [Acidimicrobiales bacterium]
MNAIARVLIVDDEPAITDLLVATLKYENFEVESVNTGGKALAVLSERSFELVILDVMLPDMLGIHVCERIRADGLKTAVLFLTARDATEDKVLGLTAGGDDYLTKPFSIEELVARLHAVLRRTTNSLNNGVPILEYADLTLDDETHEVFRGGIAIDLTATEFILLRHLLLHARKVVSKAQLLESVWQLDFDGDPNLVETYISYLRKKIDIFDPPLIQTVRGVGYSLRLPRSNT